MSFLYRYKDGTGLLSGPGLEDPSQILSKDEVKEILKRWGIAIPSEDHEDMYANPKIWETL